MLCTLHIFAGCIDIFLLQLQMMTICLTFSCDQLTFLAYVVIFAIHWYVQDITIYFATDPNLFTKMHGKIMQNEVAFLKILHA